MPWIGFLPAECFDEILNHLQNDQSSLYSCLFVSRFWCTRIIPFLWKKPFALQRMHGFVPLIRTYLSCLNEVEQSQLIPCCIDLPHEDLLFEYGKYLQDLSYESLHLSVRNHFQFYMYDENDGKNFPNVVNLFRHMPSLCSSLFRLDILLDVTSNYPVETIDIVNLIRAQRALNGFYLLYRGDGCQDIISALRPHANFLTSLVFDSLQFSNISLKPLSICAHLTSFTMISCQNVTIKHCNDLCKAPFHLKTLTLDDNDMPSIATISLIVKAGKDLKATTLSLSHITPEVIDAAYQHCPNITYLSIEIARALYDKIFAWIKKLNLYGLSFDSMDSMYNNTSEILSRLAQCLPPTLWFLEMNCSFSTDDMLQFINTCSSPLSHWIITSDDGSGNFTDMPLALIDQFFSTRNILKVLGLCGPFTDLAWNVQSLEIIKSLKERGVKVVDTREVHLDFTLNGDFSFTVLEQLSAFED
ncbi:2687_t:CDS:2 [Dentiscutata erythropus]|uniref:2687_t:CDS:1 n=1 Tax=Dentiscutata erythropus TaxID=1348616 RepID=A0A9N9NGT7_9GLOM|nr:2687_t:CDS:2 [Dentiscutata erythropus]